VTFFKNHKEKKMKYTLRVAIAAMAIASLLTACGKKSNSSASNLAPADNSAAANHSSNSNANAVGFQAVEGAVTFGGVANEDGSVITDAQLAAIISAFPDIGSGLAIVHSATSASVTADGTITLADASGTLAVVKADGSVVSSRAAFPVVAVGVTQVNGSSDKTKQGECQEQIHFTLHQQTTPPKEQPAKQGQQQKEEKAQVQAGGVSTWVVMACPAPKQEQKGQEQGKDEKGSKQGKQGQEQGKVTPAPSATPCPKEQPKEQPKTPEQPKQESKEQPKATPCPTAQPKQEQGKQEQKSSEQPKQGQSSGSSQSEQKK
jgi:hypothetical protein